MLNPEDESRLLQLYWYLDVLNKLRGYFEVFRQWIYIYEGKKI